MLDFIDYHTNAVLSEATGVDKNRILQGKMSFEDKQGNLWKAVPTSWTFSVRYAPNAPQVSTTKKVGAKPTMQMIELPAFVKLAKTVTKWIGTIPATKAKGIVTLAAKCGDKSMVFGRYLSSNTEPSALSNTDFQDAGFGRASTSATESGKGGRLSAQLTGNFFLEGAEKKMISFKAGVVAEHFVFKNVESLKARILNNMKNSTISTIRNPVLIKETQRFLEELQKTGNSKFDWAKIGDLMTEEDHRKYGIFFVSEIAWPFIVMGAGKSLGGGFPGLSKIEYFAVPTDSTNDEYDSCLKGLQTTGEMGYLFISSKAKLKGAKGANASAIGKLRVAAKAIAASGAKPNNPFLETLLPYINNLSDTSSPGASIVMPYSIREIVKINSSVIPDAVKFWRLLVILTGWAGNNRMTADEQKKKLAKYSKEEIDAAKNGILAIQKKFGSGVTLPGINKQGVIDQTIAGFLQPKQWEKFAEYLPNALCKLVIQGLNHDPSDFKPPHLWQVTLDNTSFSTTGVIHLEAKNLSSGQFKYVFTGGKNVAYNPTRNIAWIGYEPL
jgi:hypothetical protein